MRGWKELFTEEEEESSTAAQFEAFLCPNGLLEAPEWGGDLKIILTYMLSIFFFFFSLQGPIVEKGLKEEKTNQNIIALR